MKLNGYQIVSEAAIVPSGVVYRVTTHPGDPQGKLLYVTGKPASIATSAVNLHRRYELKDPHFASYFDRLASIAQARTKTTDPNKSITVVLPIRKTAY